MYKKIRTQLTIICALGTGIITIIMTCFCLFIVERGLTKNEYGKFLTSINAIYSHLKTQTNLSTEWFSQTENNGQFILYIEDNAVPIKNGNLIVDPHRSQLIQTAKDAASRNYHLDISDATITKVISKQIEFTLVDKDNISYYISAAFIPRNDGFLGVLAIYSLEDYRKSILMQRFLFFGINSAAIILLALFSYFFTTKTLSAVEENRKKQVEFIAAASHELRSPLTVISSSMSAMKKASAIQASRFEAIIDSEIKRMSRLVNDMLTLASADNQSWSLHFEDTSIDVLLLNTYEAFQTIAANKNIQLSISLPDDLLPTIKCDKQRMEQVLTILVSNALSYTNIGGKISLSIKQKPHKLEVSVIDNGIGISNQDKEHIFERFFRADTSHKSKEHFGLGLCIAYEIVKLHKGSLRIYDTYGGGATFLISLTV